MSRQPRLVIPGQPLHIIQRGNNRMPLFLGNEDFNLCSMLLHGVSERERCAIHAYVLMGNHLHLLATPKDKQSLARMMQSVGLTYARYFNHRYERTGTVFEGRYRSTTIQSERYFFECSRYIELNPVRASIVNNPGDYRWSSFASNVGTKTDALVTPHSLFHSLGNSVVERRATYLALFDVAIDPAIIDSIREATNAGTDVSAAALRKRPKKKRNWLRPTFSHGGDRRGTDYREFVADNADRL